MSLITTCPSCGTRFRVVADQLRISEGWVRCGQCQEVFDAGLHLDAALTDTPVSAPTAPQAVSAGALLAGAQQVQSAEAFAAEPAPESAPQPPPPPGYELPVPVWSEDHETPDEEAAAHDGQPALADHLDTITVDPLPAEPQSAEPVWDKNYLPSTVAAYALSVEAQTGSDGGPAPSEPAWAEQAFEPTALPSSDPLPMAAANAPQATPVEALTTAAAIESAAQKLVQAETHAAGAAAAAVPTLFASQEVEAELVDIDPALEPGFVRAARRQAWWQKPLVRVAMGAAVVVLPVALMLQVALHERNTLVAWQPGLRPALEFMCTALQCDLGPRQQIAAMVVSGSAFTKTDADRSYQLNLSIQNQSRAPVGMPAVELTLTDAQDQAIARKVIGTKELAAPQELRAGAEWSVVLPVTTPGLNLQVAGYRVLLFYP